MQLLNTTHRKKRALQELRKALKIPKKPKRTPDRELSMADQPPNPSPLLAPALDPLPHQDVPVSQLWIR